jgi:hypothetical protein
MGERSGRIAQNESLFRAVNEEIEGLNRGMAEISDQTLHIVCECGSLDCSLQLIVPIADYERVRADGALFLVKAGHELPAVETVVEQTPQYAVVRKKPGKPEEIARAADPRST